MLVSCVKGLALQEVWAHSRIVARATRSCSSGYANGMAVGARGRGTAGEWQYGAGMYDITRSVSDIGRYRPF